MTVQPAAPAHSAGITAIAFEPGGTWFATGSGEGSIRLWDTQTGKHKGSLPGRKHGVGLLAISPDSKYIASMAYLVGNPGTDQVNVWNVKSRKLHRVFKSDSLIVYKHIAFSADGQYLMVVAQQYPGDPDKSFRLMAYDFLTGKPRGTIPVTIHSRIYPIKGTREVWIRKDMHSLHRIRVPSLTTVRIEKLRRREIHSLVYCRGRALVASVGKTTEVRDLDKSSWRTLVRFKRWYVKEAVVVSPCTDRVALRDATVGCSGSMRCKPGELTLKLMTATKKGARARDLKGHSGDVGAFAYSPDGRFLATGGVDMKVILWSTTIGNIHSQVGPAASIASLAFSSENRKLAVGDYSGWVRVYDLSRGGQTTSFSVGKRAINSMAFTTSGRQLYVHSPAKELWNLSTAKKANPQKMPAAVTPPSANYPVTVHPGKNTVDVTIGSKTFKKLQSANQAVHSPVSRFAAALEGDPFRLPLGPGPFHEIPIWSIDTGKRLGRLKSHDTPVVVLAFSRDGRFLASAAAGGVVKVWRVR